MLVIKMRYEIETNILDKNRIEQKVFVVDEDFLKSNALKVPLKPLSHTICDLQEQGVRDALMKLGWVAPGQNRITTAMTPELWPKDLEDAWYDAIDSNLIDAFPELNEGFKVLREYVARKGMFKGCEDIETEPKTKIFF